MIFSRAVALCMSAGAVQAFQDTSPFLFFSSSELQFTSPQLTTAASLSKEVASSLAKCPSSFYILVHQPSVSSADFGDDGPSIRLKDAMTGRNKGVKSRFSVSDVAGEMHSQSIEEILERKCQAGSLQLDASTGMFDLVDDERPRIVKVNFPYPGSEKIRAGALRENDVFLSNLIRSLPTADYTVIYTTSPISSAADYEEPTSYEMDHSNSPLVHMELKREFDVESRQNDNTTLPDGPLFERYQYFTPGIFMGLFASTLLLTILYVAIRGVASLEISYYAFDKEMGPAAQKKG